MAFGNLKIENYVPYVKDNQGIRSAYPITTTNSLAVGATVITSSDFNSLAVGPNGTTNPVLGVDSSVASQAAGILIQGRAAGSTVFFQVISSGTNEGITINPKASAVVLMGTGTGNTGLQVGGASSVSTVRLISNSSNANALAVGPNGTTTPILAVDASTASAVAGLNVKGAATGGTVAITTTDSGSNTSLTVASKGTGTITFNPAITATAGGASNDGIQYGSLSVGLYTGTGAPSFSAMNGSIYTDSNATTTTTRIYVNKSGAGTAGTTWTALTTAA